MTPQEERSDFAFPEAGEYTQFRYRGAMPQMRDIEMVISRDGRTLRVEGRPFVPSQQAPFELVEGGQVVAKYWTTDGTDMADDEIEDLKAAEGLDYLYKNQDTGKWYVVYPIAVGKTQFYPGRNKFDLVVPRRSSSSHTWHQMPYIGYKGGKYGVGSIAFHTPYTSIANNVHRNAGRVGEILHVLRGRVSIACKRMAPEHVLELAYILGLETDVVSSGGAGHRREPYTTTLVDILNERGEGNFIESITGWDRVNDHAVDVEYPTFGWIQIPSDAFVHETWDAADLGKQDWIQWRDERGGSWHRPPNPSDPFDNQLSTFDYDRDGDVDADDIVVVNPLPSDHPDADTQ